MATRKIQNYNSSGESTEIYVGGTAPENKVLTDAVDNLTTDDGDKALSARQGKVLEDTKSDTTHSHAVKDLTDTPAHYLGNAGKALVVNATADGMEFATNGDAVLAASNIFTGATNGFEGAMDIGGNVTVIGAVNALGGLASGVDGTGNSGVTLNVGGTEDIAKIFIDNTDDTFKVQKQTGIFVLYTSESGVPSDLPDGGTTGQVLIKTSNGDQDTEWSDVSGGDMYTSVYDSTASGTVDDAEKVNGHTVATDVPAGALFTDTLYNDTDVLKDSDTLSSVSVTNKIMTQVDVASSGDMLKSTYDTNDDGIVDNAAKVNNLTVQTAVPTGALFTDTLYDDTSVTNHISNVNNPHIVTKAQLGLGAVENYSSADLPLSVAAATAITNMGNSKENLLGFPAADGYVLASTAGGVRSWVNKNTLGITSVNGDVGPIVTLGTADIAESGNLYFTNLRADNRVQAAINDTTISTTTLYSSSKIVASIAAKETHLGNPSANGQVLSSTTAGVRTWIDQGGGGGGGDMYKATYDTDNSGVVDNSEKVNNLTVDTAVPVGALFTDTDTVYDDTAIQAAVAANTAKDGITSAQAAAIVDNTAKVTNVDHPLVEEAVPSGAVFTDTVYDDTAIQLEVDANTAKTGITTQQIADITANNAKVSDVAHPLVETAVPAGALFTDTIYDDSAVLKDSDTASPVTPTNKLITQSDTAGVMLRNVYDTDDNGIVDNAQKVNNLTVETAVPASALFTDTVYDASATLVDSDAVSAVTGTNKLITENEIATGGFGDMLKADYDTDDSGIVDSAETVLGKTVGTSVPVGAEFTDTVYDSTAVDAHMIDTTNPHTVTKSQVSLGSVDNTSDADKPVSTATQTAITAMGSTKEDDLGLPVANNYVLTSDTLGNRAWFDASSIGVTSVNGATGVVTLDSGDITENTNLYFTTARADARIQAAIQDTVSSSTTIYSSAKIDAIVSGSLNYLGGWDASTNTPTISDASGSNGDYYKVTTAGSQDLGSGSITFSKGDDVIHNGSKYEGFGTTIAVSSVNAKTGTVVLDTDDIDEGSTHLYYTNARVDGRLVNLIDDNQTVTNLTWSSTKINTAITNGIGAITYPVISVNGNTGAVVLVKGDLGLGNVDNTTDLAKPISTATQTELTRIEDKVNVNTTEIGKNTTAIGNNATAITTNAGNISTNTTNIGTNTTAIGDNTTNIGLVITGLSNHEADVTNPHTVTATQIGLDQVDNTSDVDKPVSTAQQTAIDTGDSERMQWKNMWTVGTYNKNDTVLDGAWSMVANKTTSDRPAPQPSGEPIYSIADDPMIWTNKSNVSTIVSGQTYTITENGWVKSIRIWVPIVGANIVYRFVLSNVTDPNNPISEIVETSLLVPGEWNTIQAGLAIIPVGAILRLEVEALNSSASTTISGTWAYEGKANLLVPDPGEWVTNLGGTKVRISKTDANAVDRSSELVLLTPQSRLKFAQASDATKFVTYRTSSVMEDKGTYYEVEATKIVEGTSGIPDVSENTTTTIVVPTASSTSYVEKSGHWNVQPSFASVAGFLEFDGVAQSGSNTNAYGIDMQFQEASVSADWDLLSLSSSGGGGGSTVPTTIVIDDLISTSTVAALSANQGRVLDIAKEDDLGNPATDGEVLVSTAAGVRSWSVRSATWGSLTGSISNQTDLQSALNGKSDTTHTHTAVYEPKNTNIQAHITNTSNPHFVTQSQIGLGNVSNTSDANKPISTLQQTAIDAKENLISNPSTTGQVLTSTTGGVRSWTTVTDTNDAAVWGNITGSLSNQTDLSTALDGKLDKTGGTVTGDIDIVSGSGAKLNIQSTVAGGQPQLHLTDNTGVPRAIFGVDTTTGDAGITRIDATGTPVGTLRLDTLGNVKLLAGPTETTPIPTADAHLVNKKYVDDYGETLEGDLGLPAGNNYVLASDTAGNRSWFDAASIGVTSVNGATGVVTLATGDIAESSNLYFTTSRADARVQAAINDTTASATELYSSTKTETVVADAITAIVYPVTSVNTATGAVVLDTDDVTEGTSNLYYTEAKTDARIQAAITDTSSSVTTLYSSSKIESLVSGALSYKGGWNATTNTPTISDASGSNGDFYKCEVAGTQNLGSGSVTFSIGDDVIHNGVKYERFGSTSAIDSVNGETGVVVLDTGDIAESGNLYFTNARVDARLSGVIDDNAPSLTTAYSGTKIESLHGSIAFPVDSVNTKTGTVVLGTDDIAEGVSNLYYTDGRVDARLSNVIDDNVTTSALTWSSTKIDSTITSRIGAIVAPVTQVNGKTGNVTVTKADVQLGNVDNTSDADKPLSSATTIALNGKSDTNHTHTGTYEPANSDLVDHLTDTTNPHDTSLLGLTDTPSSYAGLGGKVLNVKADMTGIEFGVAPGMSAEAKPTGLEDGGELNITGGTNVEVVGGRGLKVDSFTAPADAPDITRLSWNTFTTAITVGSPAAGDIVYMLLADSGAAGPVADTNGVTLMQLTTRPTPSLVRDTIYLGYVLYNGSTWGEISAPVVVNNAAISLAEYLKTVAGNSFVQGGGRTTEAGTFSLDREAGIVWELNRNWHVNKKDPHRESFNEELAFSWKYVNRDFSAVSAATSTVDPSMYDDNGTITAVPGTVAATTIQRLYVDQRDNFWVLYGQNIDDNFKEAVARIGIDQANTVIPELLGHSIFLGYIICERNRTSWGTEKARFISATEAAGGGASSSPIQTFLELTDTPSTYVANQMLIVNSTGDGVVGLTIPPLGVGKYIDTSIAIASDSSALALDDGTANNNIGIGINAGQNVTTGSNNVIIGTDAGQGNSTNAVTGHNNLILGYTAGNSITSGSNNVFLGSTAGDLSTTQSNTLSIASGGNTLVSGNFSSSVFQVHGEVIAKSVRFEDLHSNSSSANITVSLTEGQYQTVTLTSNAAMAITQPLSPCTFYIHIHQDATGGRTLSFPSGKWVNGTVKTITGAANSHDLLMIHYYGSGSYVFELMQNLG